MNSCSRPLLLAIDTCGPSGSVALGRLTDGEVELLGETELEGRTYSATLISAIDGLLKAGGVSVADLAALVIVNGPGSFTGVRVGLAAAKGLAEPAQIPLVALSRLAVLAAGSATECAALDAHRHEVFLRFGPAGEPVRELLAGADELAALTPPARIAVCDEAAGELLATAWPRTELLRRPAPTAAEALRLAAPRLLAGDFDNAALLDGHYLRRSDAEIFGESMAAQIERQPQILQAHRRHE
jgi:tRNA threonylcarbamoyladenosine biosynthesis protein TsaB